MFYASEFWLELAHSTSFTVAAVYFVQDVGMNPLQLVLVGTAMEIAVFVFEIPTGVVADTYSRRLSLIIGWLVMGVSSILIASTATFGVILAAYALWGLGYTFTSGAHQAWITDEVGVENVGRVFARGQQWGYGGGLLGVVASVSLASVQLPLAIAVGGVVSIAFALFAAWKMPEAHFQRPDRGASSSWTAAARTARSGGQFVRRHPMLMLIMGIAFFAGASTESFDRLWEAQFIREVGLPSLGDLDPVVWFGLFGVVSMLLGLFASQYLVRRFERIGQQRLAQLLMTFTALQVLAVVAFALSSNFALAAAAMWSYYLTRSLINPVYDTWINEQISDSSVRATVISTTGQADAIGQVVGGPGLGAIGTGFGLRAALLAGGVLLAPALALYGRALRYGGKEPEFVELKA